MMIMNDETINTSAQTINQQPNDNMSLDDKLIKLQDKWTDIIRELNEKLKTLHTAEELLTEIYTKRQDAVDLYYGIMKVLSNRTRDFKCKAAVIYNNLKTGQNGLRYTNESSITIQIEAKLTVEKECIDLLTNFTNFMKDTIQTIDNIIYGVNAKIKIYEMLNGLKF